MLALYFLYKQKYLLLILLVGADLVVNSQALLFFAPNKIYENAGVEDFLPLHNPQLRTLTRNFNYSYTDFGAYWDALVVRAPFSDSYVDELELKNYSHLQRMHDGLSPDWNMAQNLRAINGYTTLMPQAVSARWNIKEVAMNNLEPISLDNKLLGDWAVKYYLVDNWFPNYEGKINLPKIASSGYWDLYELPAKPRFRYEDNTAVEFLEFSENPNQINLQINNSANKNYLIIADNYDPSWQATINGKKIELENYQGMRRVKLEGGENKIKIYYWPKLFYVGLVISIISWIIFLWSKKKKFF